MKSIIILLITACMSVTFCNCSNKSTNELLTSDTSQNTQRAAYIPIKVMNYKKIVQYIINHGNKKSKEYSLTNDTYSLQDKQGNYHEFNLELDDSEGDPLDINAYAKITVTGSKEGALTEENSFKYIIESEYISPAVMVKTNCEWKDSAIAKSGYEEILSKTGK